MNMIAEDARKVGTRKSQVHQRLSGRLQGMAGVRGQEDGRRRQ